jgi:hypothetical protein
MKRAFLAMALIGTSIVAYAQDQAEPLISRELIFDVIHICAVITIIYLISSFIVQLVRRNFEFRLKSKIIERQPDQQVVDQLVRPEKGDQLNTVLQWICVLAAVGFGLIIMDNLRPFGLHSLAIMTLSVAAGLGAYYLFAKRAKHQER